MRLEIANSSPEGAADNSLTIHRRGRTRGQQNGLTGKAEFESNRLGALAQSSLRDFDGCRFERMFPAINRCAIIIRPPWTKASSISLKR